MKESFEEFNIRLDSFQSDSFREIQSGFATNPRLCRKVDGAGNFIPFYGDTIIYELNSDSLQLLTELQNHLYTAEPDCFAMPFSQNSFHLTLHELVSGNSLEKLKVQLNDNREKIRCIFRDLRDEEKESIHMKSTYVYDMARTSLVLGFNTDSEQDYRRLLNLYEKFEVIHPLAHLYTPHITLAYYKPGYFSGKTVRKLLKLAEVLSQRSIEITLDFSRLKYVTFDNMNHISIYGIAI